MPGLPIFLQCLYDIVSIHHMPQSIIKVRFHSFGPISIDQLLEYFLVFFKCTLARHSPHFFLIYSRLLEGLDLSRSVCR
jgi:hypothetical protein